MLCIFLETLFELWKMKNRVTGLEMDILLLQLLGSGILQ